MKVLAIFSNNSDEHGCESIQLSVVLIAYFFPRSDFRHFYRAGFFHVGSTQGCHITFVRGGAT